MRLSLRIQQTALFVAVILVAMLVLSVWLMGELENSILDLARAEQVKDANAVAVALGPSFPVTARTLPDIRSQVTRYADIFEDDIRVYDDQGRLVDASISLQLSDAVVAAAREAGLTSSTPYAVVLPQRPGPVVAASAIHDTAGHKSGVVIVSNNGLRAWAAIETARSELQVAAVVALVIAGLLGLVFSDLIARQTKRLAEAANAVAEGDFSRRLPRGLLPGEIRELVDAFNRMAEQLGTAFDRLRGQEAAQREFVANASHELRTPIAALKGAVEILEDGAKEKPPVRDQFLATMALEIERLQRLVDHLFTLAQVDAGRLELHLRPEPLGEVVWLVVRSLSPIAEDAGIALHGDLADGPLTAMCDRDRITQVLMGFVENAIRHTGEGGSVVIGAWRTATGVELSVSDDGSGIPADALPHIFDRFYSGAERGRGGRGSGLGLAIAKEIVEAHGSHIRVESEPGEGARFSFELSEAPGDGGGR